MKRNILIAINAFLWGTVVYLIFWLLWVEMAVQLMENYYVLFI